MHAANNGWTVVSDVFNKDLVGLQECLTTLGNGNFCSRGAHCTEKDDLIHYPGTYIPSGYNRLCTKIDGHDVWNEDLVNFPNWLCIQFRVEGEEWFSLQTCEILSYKKELHLDKGLLVHTIQMRDKAGHECTMQEHRFVHAKQHQYAGIKLRITPDNWDGTLEVRSGIDADIINDGVARYRSLSSRHLEHLSAGVDPETKGVFVKVQTNQSNLQVAYAAHTRVLVDEKENTSASMSHCTGTKHAYQVFSIAASKGKCITLEKMVAFFTSRDVACRECLSDAREALGGGNIAPRFEELVKTHVAAWASFWDEIGLDVEGKDGDMLLLLLRLHTYHLAVSVPQQNLDAGLPARGWHGEAYRGHVFWDELYIMPFLTFHMPSAAKHMLMYRYQRLGRARRNAAAQGYAGAMFPWQSGSNGGEESQTLHLNPKSGRWIPDNSAIQRHVSLAIAFNVWKYFQMTKDMEFLISYGAEMLIDIARFFVSLTSFNKEEGRYEIHSVMGPDEYHDAYPDKEDDPGLNNNAYTNILVAWLLSVVIELKKILPERNWDVTESELATFDVISHKLKIVFHKDGILSQFEGYEALKEFPWEEYRKKYDDIHRLDRVLEAEGDSCNNYKASKQADTLMLFYLFSGQEIEKILQRLGYKFDPKTEVLRNVEYYSARTCHGSTLSHLIHAWVIARFLKPEGWDMYQQALRADLEDVQGGTTKEGVHLGMMVGTVDLTQRCYLGLEIYDNVLWVNPCLPQEIDKLSINVHYAGQLIKLTATRGQEITLSCFSSSFAPVSIGFKGEIRTLGSGESQTFSLK